MACTSGRQHYLRGLAATMCRTFRVQKDRVQFFDFFCKTNYIYIYIYIGSDVASSRASASGSSGSQSDPPLPPEPAAAPAVERQQAAIPFGPWTISRVRSGPDYVGWGGNCNCHSNAKRQNCKRMFTYAGSSDSETRMLAKLWLLQGGLK